MTIAVGHRWDATPTEIELFLPENDDPSFQPEFSIVIPALNEHITIGEFVDWCKEGLAKAGVAGEILIVDSSTDGTPQIALSHGARVLRTLKRGLGRAYIDALPYVRGRYVILGDCDLTYDFREIGPFVDRLREGYEFVMGSRFKGSIEPGAMPKLHRYFGTPATNFAFNAVNGTKYSDIHCGMRGMTLDLLKRINLTSQGWDYAPEMIAKAEALHARAVDVPIKFYKDREGRTSHHKRAPWYSPWMAGWHSLRVTFVFGAERVLVPLAFSFIALGAFLMILLSRGPAMIIPGMTWTLNALFLGVTLAVCGVAILHLSILASIINDRAGEVRSKWKRRFPYTKSVGFGAGLIAVGLVPTTFLVTRYVQHHLILLPEDLIFSHLSTVGLCFIMIGILQLSFTLLLHLLLDRFYYA
jgi:glycosyltransferase involved in cell wall biosynthesis